MCNTKCNNEQCCHEEDLLCCMPMMHCCGGYSEHNNCCPHDRCCNHPCGVCCDPCGNCDKPMCCCCYKLKKAFDAFKDETGGMVSDLDGRLKRLEIKEGDDFTYLVGQIGNLAEKEQADVDALWAKEQEQDDALAEERRQRIAGDAALDNKINLEEQRATRKEGELEDLIEAEEARAKNKENTLANDIQELVETCVTNVSYNTSTKNIQKTINGTTTDVVKIIPYSDRGSANGVAPLNGNNLIDSTYLPSYVDDVVEWANYSQRPQIGESGKIYVDLQTNLTYRWSGTDYIEISKSLAIGETASTAFAGNRGVALEGRVSTLEGVNPVTNVTKSGDTVTVSYRTGSPTTFTVASAGSQNVTINVDGTSTTMTIEQALQNLYDSRYWELVSNVVTAKSGRNVATAGTSTAAGFYDSTVN